MISQTIYKQKKLIKPTYLYIKKHSITGLKYFGKTTRDPYKYNGSGTHWTRHIKLHGKEHIITLWVSELYYDTSIVEHALHFSYENNIVESNNWANMRIEDGLEGGDTSNSPNYKKGMLNRDLSGSNNPMFGKHRPDTAKFLFEGKDKMIIANRCPVNCDGKEYNSVGEAQLSYPGISIRKRLDNPKYPQFFRLREKTKRK